jgi:hypothetical protein
MHYEEDDVELVERLLLADSDFLVEDFESSHLAYLSSLLGRSGDRWFLHYLLVLILF